MMHAFHCRMKNINNTFDQVKILVHFGIGGVRYLVSIWSIDTNQLTELNFAHVRVHYTRSAQAMLGRHQFPHQIKWL